MSKEEEEEKNQQQQQNNGQNRMRAEQEQGRVGKRKKRCWMSRFSYLKVIVNECGEHVCRLEENCFLC